MHFSANAGGLVQGVKEVWDNKTKPIWKADRCRLAVPCLDLRLYWGRMS